MEKLNLRVSGKSAPTTGTPITKCNECQGSGQLEHSSNVYYDPYGTANRRFCTCEKGTELFKLWIKEPAQKKRAQEESIKLRETCKKLSDIPARFEEKTLSDFAEDRPNLHSLLVTYVEKWREHKKAGMGLFLCGSIGTGKTHAAIVLSNELIDRYFTRVLFIKSADAIAKIRGSFDDSSKDKGLVDRMINTELLIIDDFGIENRTDFLVETFYRIIDARYSQKRPTIITSNQSLKDLSSRYIPQIASRIKEMCASIKFGGEDRRESLSPKI